MRTTAFVFALLVFLFPLTGCPSSPDHQTGQSLKDDIRVDASLEAHSGIFKRGVEQVTKNVFSAIGYGLANSIMIKGDDGLIIVDTMETREQARLVLAEFRKISAKPVKAIIYTHNHTDHIFGADVFAEGRNPVVYAHQTTHDLVNRVVDELRPATNTRGMRMFGIIRDLRPDHLVPCHTRPLHGADRIYKILTDYRDAIQFIHDQSIRGINMGLTPDQMVEYVKLPPHLADKPYLQPFYGTVAWSVRSVFAGNMGWFDGDPANLESLSPKAQARLMADPEMLAQVRSPLLTLPTFDYEKGGLVAFAKFMKLFEPQPAKLPYEPVE